MNEPDSSQTVFWTKRWEAGKTPWDFGGVPPALVGFLKRTKTPYRVLIPGCGTGYEVRAFHEMGHDVSAIEFSAPAVAHAREVLGVLGERVIHGNFFKHDFAANQYGLFLYGNEPEPPPFPLTNETAATLLGPYFRLIYAEDVTGSVPVYNGLEHWQEWERIKD